MNQLKKYEELAISSAKLGSEVLLKHFKLLSEYNVKEGAGLVTKADLESEKVICDFLLEHAPEIGILAEENGTKLTTDKRWIIDPLDGTTNFVHRIPHFSVSIGLEINQEVVVGVVLNPATKDIYHCYKKGGAYKNNVKINVSKTKELSEAMLATGFAYMKGNELKKALEIFYKLSLETHGIRRFGSAALDLCFVAEGIYDAFYERTLSPWDVCAGSLLVKEAGGKLSDFNGNYFSIYAKELLVSNGLIHDQLKLFL